MWLEVKDLIIKVPLSLNNHKEDKTCCQSHAASMSTVEVSTVNDKKEEQAKGGAFSSHIAGRT